MSTQAGRSTTQTIVTAWLVVGTLDISSAIVIWLSRGITLTRGFQSIAAGLLGTQSYEGGLGTAALGFAIHYLIALIVVSIFYAASRKLRILTQYPFVFGPLYGIAVYLFMYWVVLPNRFPTFRHRLSNDLLAIAIHICLIGLPTAWIVSRSSRPKEPAT